MEKEESKLSSSSNSLKQAENLTPPSMDVSSLIENSKKLIADVNRTLEKSKQQIIRTFSASKGGPGPLEEAKEVLNEYISKNVTNNISKSNEKCCVDVNEKTDRASNNGTDVLSFKSAEHVSIERSEAISNEETDWTSVYLSAQSNSFPVPEPVTDIPNLPVDDYKLQEKQLMDMASSIDICSGSKVRMSTSTKSFDCGDTFKSQVYVNEDASSVLLQNESFSFGSSTCSHIVEGNDHVPEGLVRVWVSQVIMALDSLHKRDIIWRDFNPSNLLLDEGGSILLTYKYSWSTNDYWYIKSQGFPEDENDCWMLSLGYIAPELFNPDVASCFPCGFTSHTQINFPSTISEEAESLISSLLCADPMERLGSSNGVKVIKEHPFFIGIEWPQ
ncbi:Ribosomal protein S6 kinase delta-1 [Armadillidium vulgare]|nr:Ribosomal protein S6 kinase delta-1 [Armadillidium vulgare]